MKFITAVVLSICYLTSSSFGQELMNNETVDSGSVVSTGRNLTEEEQAIEQQHLVEEWTKMFISMSRVPRKGRQILIFPGLYNDSRREMRSFEDSAGNSSSSTQPVAEALTDDPIEPDVETTGDSRLLNNLEPFVFDDIQALDEEQRQRRRLRSARKDVNLLEADQDHLATMINSVLSTSRDFHTNQTIRQSVIRYLTEKMRSFGLVTGHQVFDPQEFSVLFDGHVPNGTNVIGILPGELWGTKEDQVIVIGAHWDTVPNSDGMDDNGSGVAAVLEVARAMTEASCRSKHSVIFVAFDLEEVGCLGSIFFVRDFLIPKVLEAHGGARLQGAFILDTIMNFNDTQFSQTLSPEWQAALPDFWNDIQAENQTGNFLAVMYRKDVDSPLAHTFAHYWKGDDVRGPPPVRSSSRRPKHFRVDNKEIRILDNDLRVETVKPSKSRFRLKKVRVDMEPDVGDQLERLAPWIDLLRSDHSRFWYHHVEGYQHLLPAVLITDTAPFRGVMQECYHQQCDSSSANKALKFASVQFLAKTCQALIDSTVNLSDAKCFQSFTVARPSVSEPWKSSSKALRPSTIVIALIGLFFLLR